MFSIALRCNGDEWASFLGGSQRRRYGSPRQHVATGRIRMSVNGRQTLGFHQHNCSNLVTVSPSFVQTPFSQDTPHKQIVSRVVASQRQVDTSTLP